MTAHPLKADPNISLDVFHQVTNMDLTIGIRQGGSDEKATLGATHEKQINKERLNLDLIQHYDGLSNDFSLRLK
jgi:hypothetical protein